MKKFRSKLENFVYREKKKLRILEKFDDDFDEEDVVVDIESESDDDEPPDNAFLLFKTDIKKLRDASYKADHLDIQNLPLCQLYIFREEICKQHFKKLLEERVNESNSYLFCSSMFSSESLGNVKVGNIDGNDNVNGSGSKSKGKKSIE